MSFNTIDLSSYDSSELVYTFDLPSKAAYHLMMLTAFFRNRDFDFSDLISVFRDSKTDLLSVHSFVCNLFDSFNETFYSSDSLLEALSFFRDHPSLSIPQKFLDFLDRKSF